MKIKVKLSFLVIGCSAVATEGGIGNLMGGLGNKVWGQQHSAVGGNSKAQHWGCFQPLRTALHTISISLSNTTS